MSGFFNTCFLIVFSFSDQLLLNSILVHELICPPQEMEHTIYLIFSTSCTFPRNNSSLVRGVHKFDILLPGCKTQQEVIILSQLNLQTSKSIDGSQLSKTFKHIRNFKSLLLNLSKSFLKVLQGRVVLELNIMVWVRGDRKDHLLPNPLPQAGAPFTRPHCSELQPAWP